VKASYPLRLILPEVADSRDACVARLERLVSEHPGISLMHLASDDAALCVHFDPARIQVAEVERVIKAVGARLAAEYGHASIAFKALAGEDSGRRLEDLLRLEDGVIEASANVPAQLVRVEYDRTKVKPDRLAQVVNEAGFGAIGPGDKKRDEQSPSTATAWLGSHRELVWSLAAAVFLVTAWVGGQFADWPRQLTIPLYLGAYAFGSWDLAKHTLASLRRGSFTFDIDLLMLVAALGAAALDAWAEGAFLLTLFALAHALEHYAMDRARGAIRALADLAPRMAHVQRNGVTEDVPVEAVKVDDIVLIRPGEQIPVDGAVRTGRSTVNQAPVTGESVPVDKDKGDEVFAGTVNGEGALEVQTTRAVGDRTLDRVIRLVEEAQTAKAPTQRFTERFERVFVPVVLLSAALVAVGPPLLGWSPWATSIYRALALLVAASPCALALGTPSAVLAGIAHAARRGVLIKGGVHLENLGSVRAVAFDKTGTLTIGRPEVTDVVPATDSSADELLRVAAAVERQSQHPLAQAVTRAAELRKLPLPEAGPLESITARGVRASVEGDVVEIGSVRLWDERAIPLPVFIALDVNRLQESGRSVMIVRHGERWLGVLGLADEPRPEAKAVLAKLRTLSVQSLAMLTGDNAGVAKAVAQQLGIDDVRADLLPEDKVNAIQGLMRDYGSLAMVGDGVNDAPALAHATVGIAMGGAGTGVALETADVALMGDDLTTLPFAIGLSRESARVIKQNLAISMAVIGILAVATLGGWAGIGIAVLVHEGSTLVVIANSLRLLAFKNS
jgi:Zn2+/Cd2+-exporting ATPase